MTPTLRLLLVLGASLLALEASAHGGGLNAGEPGYGVHLDRDGDGIGCEPYRGRR